MTKNVIHIRVAEETEPGEFYLILRKSSPFGGGGSITYSIDNLVVVEASKGDPVFFRAFQLVDGQPKTVCMFPITSNFEVVRKSQTDRLTELEAAERQKAVNKMLDEVLGDAGDPPVTLVDTKTGQYL